MGIYHVCQSILGKLTKWFCVLQIFWLACSFRYSDHGIHCCVIWLQRLILIVNDCMDVQNHASLLVVCTSYCSMVIMDKKDKIILILNNIKFIFFFLTNCKTIHSLTFFMWINLEYFEGGIFSQTGSCWPGDWTPSVICNLLNWYLADSAYRKTITLDC